MAPIFFDFDKFEGAAEQVDHKSDRLGDSFADLGGGFVKLVDAATDELKIGAASANKLDLEFKHDERLVGHDFIKVGLDFLKVDVPLHKFDDTLVKFADEFLKITPSEAEGFSLAGDLVKYEGDLKVTGSDFVLTGFALKGDAPTESLSLNFSKIAVDYKAQADDALKIGDDFIKLGAVAGDLKLQALSEALIKYGEDYVNLAAEDLKVAADMLKVS